MFSLIIACCSAVDFPAIEPVCFSHMTSMSIGSPPMPLLSPVEPAAHPLAKSREKESAEYNENF